MLLKFSKIEIRKKKATSLSFVVIACAIFTEEKDIKNVASEIII